MTNKSLLYERVYGELKKQILNGHYRAGQMIPSEQELMEQYGVSRVTTTRALRRLVSENLIYRKVGAGTFVSDTLPMSNSDEPRENRVKDKTANLVGLVIPQIWGDYAISLISRAERILQEHGTVLATTCSYGNQEIEQRRIEELTNLRVKGLIIFPTDGIHYNEGILRLYVERFPTVIVDKQLPGVPFPYVTSDNYGGAKQLTEHLLGLGHRRIGFVSISLEGTSTLSDRYDGFLAALGEAGIPFSDEDYLDSLDAPVTEDGYDSRELRILMDFIRQHPDLTAIFSTRYELAEHLYKAAEELGIKVPEDLSIVCFDGASLIPAHGQPTHMVQDGGAVATEALKMLFRLFDGKTLETNSAIVPTKLHIGNSTAMCRNAHSIR